MAAAYSALIEHPGSEPLELDHADVIAAPDGITHLRHPMRTRFQVCSDAS
jgi:hypothetical protein